MAEHRLSCASCGAENEEDARYCEACGSELGRRCATCGVEARTSARFCRGCGAALDGGGAPTESAPVRKHVTVLFADLAGSTAFEEGVDAETAREVMARYHELLRRIADRHRAGVTKYIGDGFMAVWGVPDIAEDDAARALDTAIELQAAFVEVAAGVAEVHGASLSLRVAVNTGEVVVGAEDADLVGDALNVGARLEQECPSGAVVVGEQTWRATRDLHEYQSLGEIQVKGRAAAVTAYLRTGDRVADTDVMPFVGRDTELARLRAVYDRAVGERVLRLVSVIGDAGVGKTRLAHELVDALPGVRVIEARCVPDGGVALAPIVERLQAADLEAELPVGTPDRDRLLRVLGDLAAGAAGSVEEAFWALRRTVELLASRQPLVLLVDDVQWADPLLLDLVEHLVEWVRDAPVLALVLARPELRDLRRDLAEPGRRVTDSITLGGLADGATERLAAELLGTEAVPPPLLERLASSTEGNPLFVRELIRMLVHDGVLEPDGGSWRLTVDAGAIEVPPSIQSLLATRIERVDPSDRRLLEVAAVIGNEFAVGAVVALLERDPASVRRSLDDLRRVQLVAPTGAYAGDEPLWRFHHVLIRDVAYRRLLKSDRAELHERLAVWTEAAGARGGPDPDELIARHLEAAHGYRVELGTRDEHTADLAARASSGYLASARRALDRDELMAAGALAARGLSLTAGDVGRAADLLLLGCEAFLSAGDVGASRPLLDQLDALEDPDLAPWAACYRSQLEVYTDPDGLPAVDVRLGAAIDAFGARGDQAGLAKAHRVRASARVRLGRVGECEADLDQALASARQVDDRRQVTSVLGTAPSVALWGPSPVPRAGGRCLDVVRLQRLTTAAPSVEATSLRCQAVLEALRGRVDNARGLLARAAATAAELGHRHGLMETELYAGIVEMVADDPVAAEPHFRTALEGLDALGVGADAGQAAALLARSLLAQGRVDEADAPATESQRLAGRNLKTAIAWRTVRAELLATQGRHDEARALAEDAVEIGAGTDIILDRADASAALARVCSSAGDEAGALRARAEADRLYTAKGALALVTGSGGAASAHLVTEEALPTAAEEVGLLAVRNRGTEVAERMWRAYTAGDLQTVVDGYAQGAMIEDRRRLADQRTSTREQLAADMARLSRAFPVFRGTPLMVCGDRLVLEQQHLESAEGDESTYLSVMEVDDEDRVAHVVRFDGDDIHAAREEIERRYYASEGRAFAVAGAVLTRFGSAMGSGDPAGLRAVLHPDLVWRDGEGGVFEERSAEDFIRSSTEYPATVEAIRVWAPAARWLSPTCYVMRMERQIIGSSGEEATWNKVCVVEVHDGLVTSGRSFRADEAAEAIAFARELAGDRPRVTRLSMDTLATRTAAALRRAHAARDWPGMTEQYAPDVQVLDRRSVDRPTVVGAAAVVDLFIRATEDYDLRYVETLAVRGDRLGLDLERLVSADGYESDYLAVFEVDVEGLVAEIVRFDGDDLDGAIHELDRRYYAGEGAAFAEGGVVATEYATSIDRQDYDEFRRWVAPDLAIRSARGSVWETRSLDEFIETQRSLTAGATRAALWTPVSLWLSPTCLVSRVERRRIGEDGAEAAWSKLYVTEILDGVVAEAWSFEPEAEDAALELAESLVATRDREAAMPGALPQAMQALNERDIDAARRCYHPDFWFDDRRAMSGDPIVGVDAVMAALGRLFEQFEHIDHEVLAVADRCALMQFRWSTGSGLHTEGLSLNQVADDGRIVLEVRFDVHEISAANAELERLADT